MAAQPAEEAGVGLSTEDEEDPNNPTAQNHQSELGVLLGFFPGPGVSAAYDLAPAAAYEAFAGEGQKTLLARHPGA